MSSSSLLIVKREMERAVVNGDKSRPQWAFSNYEKALGFTAFIYWFYKGIIQRENGLGHDYFEAPNVSARTVALEFMINHVTRPPVSNRIAEVLPSFKPDQEAELVITQPRYGQPWDSSLTRSTIILCREMSYLLTGILGEKLNVPGDLSFVEPGKEWLEEVFGHECAEELLGKRRLLELQDLALYRG
jgi:hypothetical protein